jgi:hypothetical protein
MLLFLRRGLALALIKEPTVELVIGLGVARAKDNEYEDSSDDNRRYE